MTQSQRCLPSLALLALIAATGCGSSNSGDAGGSDSGQDRGDYACFAGTTVCGEGDTGVAVCDADRRGHSPLLDCSCLDGACTSVSAPESTALWRVSRIRFGSMREAIDLDLFEGADAVANLILGNPLVQNVIGDPDNRLADELISGELVVLMEVVGVDFADSAPQQGLLRLHRAVVVDAETAPPTFAVDESFEPGSEADAAGLEQVVTWHRGRLVSNTSFALMRFPFDVGTGGVPERTDQRLAGARFELELEGGALAGVLGGAGRVEPILAGARAYLEQLPDTDENRDAYLERLGTAENFLRTNADMRIEGDRVRTGRRCSTRSGTAEADLCNGISFLFEIETEAAAWAPSPE